MKDLAAYLLERYERMKGKAKISEEAEFTGVNEHSEEIFNAAIQSAVALAEFLWRTL
ncbi:hypothetical protein [Venatoribacter cucullus]|uniref:Uncharacterized protein n=1 Tax=Venatoribacter cucullus TaxID=2661630 RepID=A0A9X7UY35_9GAMM|nr:hypothetical protein [Venatoribacter cucullus]QQD24156.1 hypothetical protein GJQ55_06565 [Venatoribacter cucullus]